MREVGRRREMKGERGREEEDGEVGRRRMERKEGAHGEE